MSGHAEHRRTFTDGAFSVGELLEELRRLGVEPSAITVADDPGDRYSLADWVKVLPVDRIVIVPNPDVHP
jgi:hypothetical protein